MKGCDVVVLGAGAAGLMCAARASQRGRSVIVLDHAAEPGRKILISGGGRCNFTNLRADDPRCYLSERPAFAARALRAFAPRDMLALLARHRVAWVEKARGQLFCRDSARDVLRVLLAECRAGGARILTRTHVAAVDTRGGGFVVRTDRGDWRCESLVVATGGRSIPKLGASGFGHQLARRFGLRVTPLKPGLVPLRLTGADAARLRELAGVSLPVEVRCDGAAFADRMLFTHRGISGPAILQISSFWSPGMALSVDLLPETEIVAWLAAMRRRRPSRRLSTALAERLPRRLARLLCGEWLPDAALGALDDEALREAARRLADWRLQPATSEGYRTAEVTVGGVATDELDEASMAARSVPGLYFIGEVVDVTGWLGGFNFQWAWASGHAAGCCA